ncbi:MAG: hypothetical protein ACLFN8_05510 [Candidatus Woesearchaeota archaeon]
MNKTEQKIIQTLAKKEYSDISTSNLVKEIFKEECEEIQNLIQNPQRDTDLIKLGKRNKARLHRKLLYYLSKLTEENFLKITRIEGKGEKFFALNDDKIVTDKRSHNIQRVYSSTTTIKDEVPLLTGIEQYEDERIVKRFDPQNWLTKINSFILEMQKIQNIKKLYDTLNELYPVFNDVIGLLNFQEIIDKHTPQELTNFIRKTDLDTKDYNKYINIIINLTNIKNYIKISDYIDLFSDINPDKIFIIFQTNTKTLSTQNRLMNNIIKRFSEKKIRINIQNLDLHKAPYLVGRAGAYTYSEEDWTDYTQNTRGKTIGICCSETSIYIDIYRTFKDKINYTSFRELIMKTSKALLLATAAQRKKSDILFKPINNLNPGYQNKFFSISYNYIRLWNYDLLFNQEDNTDNKFLIFNDLLISTVDELDDFCKSEETIFRSCGIPIRFKIVLSSAFKRFDKDFLSPRIYKKVLIKNLQDYYNEQIIKDIRRRESLYKVFKGGDRVRFFRDIHSSPDEIISELHMLLTNYNIPLFTYDFNTLKGEVTLNSFF